MNNIKKIIRYLVLIVFMMTAPFLVNNIFADDPPPVPAHGEGDLPGPLNGGAPIGGGLLILLGLGGGYGAYKFYKAKKKKLLE